MKFTFIRIRDNELLVLQSYNNLPVCAKFLLHFFELMEIHFCVYFVVVVKIHTKVFVLSNNVVVYLQQS